MYPTLFKLAMDILPIQASSVPCERVFSSSKQTITARRNQLSPQLVETLQLLKFSAKKGHQLTFTSGLDRDEETRQLEEKEDVEPPEDLRSYFNNMQ
jgi:hAT family C-terminal dimerisation region